MKPIGLIVSLLLLCKLSFGQRVVTIKHGSPDYKAITQEITPYANAHSSHPCRVRIETAKSSNNWAFVLTSLPCINPKDQSAGSLIALLKKGRRWTIREIWIGTTGLEDIEAQWAKKHKLPAGLIG